jgi:hypothetical protein
MKSLTAGLALCVFVAAAASGEPFVSNKYGFSVDFPMTPEVGTPQASETDDSGKPISNITIIKSEMGGVYTAMVTVEVYNRPTPIDVGSTMQAMVKGFVAQLDATLKSNKPGKLGDYRARYFSYATPDGSATGRGMVVIVPAKKPRTYIVVTMYTPSATPEDKAALEKFFASFQLE